MRTSIIGLGLLAVVLGGCAGSYARRGGAGTEFHEGAAQIDRQRRLGRIYISEQPSEAAMREFAGLGGVTVINLRRDEEMAEHVGYDEARLAHDLGMRYVHVPVSPATLSDSDVAAVSDAIEAQPGPVLMHCASGTRAAALLATHLATRRGVPAGEAIHQAAPLGMAGKGPMIDAVRRVLMKEVDDVTGEVSAERIRSDIDTLVGFGTRQTLSDTESETRGIGAARRWIKGEFDRVAREAGRRRGEEIGVDFDSHHVEADGRRVFQDVDVVNVKMTIPGSMPEAKNRLYYVIGHYDSRNSEANDVDGDSPGADDDGSGTAVCLELARVLSKHRMDATVVLMPVAGEEQGLFGSRAHARAAREQGLDIRGVLSNDIVGDPTGPGGEVARDQIRLFSEGLPIAMVSDPSAGTQALATVRSYAMESDSESRQLARYVAEVARVHDLPVKPMLVFRPDRFLRGGDHTGFNEAGYPAVRFCEVYENYDRQHQDVRVEDGVQYGDLPEYVDEAYLADVARLNAAAILNLANAPSPPPNTRVIVAELSNDTTLRWDASPEPDVAGYEVVWRATTAPEWEHFEDVGNVNEATIDLSKDNWFFGVRAYDRDGYRSPIVIPRAARE
ncbi:MAG: M28 family peptidase [Phycisphaerales bacterium]